MTGILRYVTANARSAGLDFTASSKRRDVMNSRLNRIPYGSEAGDWVGTFVNCGDCNVVVGELHILGCSVERCANCFDLDGNQMQLISCGCVIGKYPIKRTPAAGGALRRRITDLEYQLAQAHEEINELLEEQRNVLLAFDAQETELAQQDDQLAEAQERLRLSAEDAVRNNETYYEMGEAILRLQPENARLRELASMVARLQVDEGLTSTQLYHVVRLAKVVLEQGERV